MKKELTVVKRDARTSVPFSPERIINAVTAAAREVGTTYYNLGEKVVEEVKEILPKHGEVHVAFLEREVEKILTRYDMEIARAYIEYRHYRDMVRERKSPLIKDVVGLLEQTSTDILNENANKDTKVIPTQRDILAGILSRHHAKSHILPRNIVTAHDRGEIHYHDLDYAPAFPSFNCMLIDIEEMLKGFHMGNAEIETPKSIGTATAVVAQIIAQVASHIYGGTTLNRLDEVLAPYVEMTFAKHLVVANTWEIPNAQLYAKTETEKSCTDAFQSLEYEVNTLHTANGQTPFITIGFGLGTGWACRLIQKSILNTRIKGLGKKHKTAIFPKLAFIIREGLNRKPGNENYDIKQLALECASKRMYPDILNYDKVVEVTGSFKTPMGCRSFLGGYKDEQGIEKTDGRNNLGVVSINLPRIALEAKGDLGSFYSILEERLELTYLALETRIDRLRGIKAVVAPILYMEGACGVRLNADDEVLDIFKNGRASISLGYIGIHETLNALLGTKEDNFNSEYRKSLGLKIVTILKDTVVEWETRNHWGYSLYSTPSENLCNRFCQLDKKEFGTVEGVTDKGYYTNSFHLDVEKKVNPYDKLDFEAEYPEQSSGGFICYGEFPNMENNLKALEDIWDYSYDLVPYYAINSPIDECYKCGFTGEFTCTSKGFVCPSCGNHEVGTISVIRRVCGYLGNPDARSFNKGKQEEVKRRVKHS